MIALFLLPPGLVPAQSAQDTAGGTMDSEVTIMGKDETSIPVPPPWKPSEVVVPQPDMTPPDPMTLPPIPPPPGPSADDPPVVDSSGEPLP